MPGRAAEAVRSRGYPAIDKGIPAKITDVPMCRRTGGDTQSIVEVAIVKRAVPAHVKLKPAHQTVNGPKIERIAQQLQVPLMVPIAAEIMRKPPDWHVGDGVQPSKRYAEAPMQLAVVLLLQCFLFGREGRAQRVINQGQRQPGIDAVTTGVKPLDYLHAVCIHLMTALSIDVFRQVTWE